MATANIIINDIIITKSCYSLIIIIMMYGLMLSIR